jgi:RNA-binding protein YlmH
MGVVLPRTTKVSRYRFSFFVASLIIAVNWKEVNKFSLIIK